MKLLLFSVLALSLGLWIYYISNVSFDEDKISNKKILVTGASKNIGRQIALEFARLGANLVVTARTEKKLKEVVAKCSELGAPSATYIVADMSDLNQTKMVIEQAASFLGGIDILVLNHIKEVPFPTSWSGNASDLSFATESSVINYLSHVHLSSHAAPYLTKSAGRLVVISSLAGYISVPYTTSYGASKAALNHFYSTQRMEHALLKKKPFSITLCLLGYIATDNVWKDTVTIAGYPLNDTAREIIAGSVNRYAYVFVPWWGISLSIVRLVATDWFDYLWVSFLSYQ